MTTLARWSSDKEFCFLCRVARDGKGDGGSGIYFGGSDQRREEDLDDGEACGDVVIPVLLVTDEV